uniref:hypothetical protein n=1 Tax=Piscicoccus intestinalis TaxID=746033 RepID=UPI001C3F4A25
RAARRVGVPEPSSGTVTRQPPPTPAPAAQATPPHPRTTLRTACRGRDCDTDSSSDHDTQFSASWGEALIDGEATAAALATVIADQPRVLGGGVPDPGGRPTPRALAEHLRALTRATDSWLDREPTRPRADQLPTAAHTAACRLTLGARIALADVLHTLGEAAPDRM